MRNRFLYAIVLVSLSGFSCKKEVSLMQASPNSSITIVNAVDGSQGLVPLFWTDSSVTDVYVEYNWVSYESSGEYGFSAGTFPVVVYDASDTSQPLLRGKITFQPYGIYSLFLSGSFSMQNAPDTLLVQDAIPYHSPTDSAVGIRFVNVSPSAGTVSVDIQGNPPGSEVGSLGYQGVTAFKDYPATSTEPDPSVGYVFEFKSVATGNVLATYNYPARRIARFKSVSVVLAGTATGSGISTFLVLND